MCGALGRGVRSKSGEGTRLIMHVRLKSRVLALKPTFDLLQLLLEGSFLDRKNGESLAHARFLRRDLVLRSVCSLHPLIREGGNGLGGRFVLLVLLDVRLELRDILLRHPQQCR